MTKTNRTKAYSYLRFSTPDQMKGDSFRRQTKLAHDYAERHGLILDDHLTFEDLGVSAYRGKNKDTGGLGGFLKAVEVGLVEKGSYLLVESLDRISRDKTRRALRTLEDICEAGITLVTLVDERVYTTESLDSDPTALIMSILIFMRANEESATKSRRLKSSWESKRANATDKPLTSRVPAWLELDKEVGEIKIIEGRARVVQRIFQMTLDGVGQHKIAETLNQEGVPVFGSGKHWHRSYIAKLLSNTSVIGTLTPHRIEYVDGQKKRVPLEPVKNYYPAIIDEVTFDRSRAMRLETVNPQRGRHTKTELKNLFGGLGKCPVCGAVMTRVNKGSKGKAGQPKLVCSKAKAGAGCQYRSVPYDAVEGAFIDNASYILGTIPAGHDDPEVDQEVADLETAIAVTEESIEQLLDAVQGGKSPAAMERLRKLETELEKMREDHDDLLGLQSLTTSPMVFHKAEDLEAIMDTGELDRGLVNALLRQMLKGVTVDYRTGQLVFLWLHGGETEVRFMWAEDV